MRVLFIENAGNKSAGAFHSLITLILKLRKYGVESYVAITDKADGISLLEKASIPYIKMRACAYSWMISRDASYIEKLKMPFKHLYVKFHYRELLQYAIDNKIDIIHENTSACYIGKYVADKLNIPHIWHIREFMEEDFNCKFWNPRLAIRMISSSNSIIAVSEAIKKKYEKLIRSKPIERIYNGISIEDFYIKNRKINISTESKILCVGRISEGKGQQDVISAAIILKNKYDKVFPITFAGVYKQKYIDELLKKAAAAGIEDSINFIGQCDDIAQQYSKNDIVCMSSHNEAFGRVTVEAMLSGCLVIGADSGGTSEIIIDCETGYLYKSADSKDLADKLFYAITNPDKSKLIAKKGQEYAKKNFDADQNAEQIYNLYKSLLRLE